MAAPHQGEVWLFEHGNYGGRRVALTTSVAQMRSLAVGNDAVSSLRCGPGTTVVLYAEENYRGRSQAFTGDVAYVGDAWNDKASSVAVQVSGSPAAPRDYGNYGAPQQTGYPTQQPPPSYGPPPSAQGPVQGQVWLFCGPNYTGPEVWLTESCLDLAMWGFDDQVQSLRVGPNTVVRLCADLDFGGTAVTYQGDVPVLQGNINAKATSLELLVNGQHIGQMPGAKRTLATEGQRGRGINLGSIISTASPLVMNALKNKMGGGGGGGSSQPSGGMPGGMPAGVNLGAMMGGQGLDKGNVDVGKVLGILAPIVLNAVKNGQGVGGITSGVMGAAPQIAGAAFGMGGGGAPSSSSSAPVNVPPPGNYGPPQTAVEAQLMQENQALRISLQQLGHGSAPPPQQSYPPQQGGYPPQQPPQQGGYPPQQSYGQPPSGPAYGQPPSGPAYGSNNYGGGPPTSNWGGAPGGM